MNGAELMLRTAVKAGIDVCFANPGTTEMPFVSALDEVEGIRGVLGLFEGVCTGASDGYGRMTDRPAMNLLHLGPGLANGMANLHNARRAGTPVFTVVGDHATWHRPYDPPLAMDIEAAASTVSGWVRTATQAGELSRFAAAAIEAAGMGQPATLVVPHDLQWTETGEVQIAKTQSTSADPDSGAIATAVRLLTQRGRSALVLGGRALRRDSLVTAGRIAAATGCDLVCETFPGRLERGAGLAQVKRIPYLPEAAAGMLARYDMLVFAGARKPVAFFGYPDQPSRLWSEAQDIAEIAADARSVPAALESLAEAVYAPAQPKPDLIATPARPEVPEGALDGEKACAVIAALQPEGAIVVDESLTAGLSYSSRSKGCPPHTLLTIGGGSLGFGGPCAVGAAIACPDRPVLSLLGDGSAMYTVQSLWTQARERANVTTLVFSNRRYDILRFELARSGGSVSGENAGNLTDLSGVDWVRMAEAHGVPGTAADSASGLADALEKALAEDGPHLIEIRL